MGPGPSWLGSETRSADAQMCGIVGYIGSTEASPLLLEGLRRLEYRGYDSAGITVCANGALDTRKMAGKIYDLEQAIGGDLPRGTLGIAHTRWATHGAPTATNTPTPTPSPTPRFGKPVLLGPKENRVYSRDEELVLRWRDLGSLKENEWYAVRLNWLQDGQLEFGGTNIKDNFWIVPPDQYWGLADQFTGRIKQRTARVTRIDRRVGLDTVGIFEQRAGRVLVTVRARNDPVSNRRREVGG